MHVSPANEEELVGNTEDKITSRYWGRAIRNMPWYAHISPKTRAKQPHKRPRRDVLRPELGLGLGIGFGVGSRLGLGINSERDA